MAEQSIEFDAVTQLPGDPDQGVLLFPAPWVFGVYYGSGGITAEEDIGVLQFPAPRIEATEEHTLAFRGELTLPAWSIRAAEAAGDLGVLQFPALEVLGIEQMLDLSIDVGVLTLPAWNISSTESQVYVYRGELTLPPWTLRGAEADAGVLTLPAWSILAHEPTAMTAWWAAFEPPPMVQLSGYSIEPTVVALLTDSLALADSNATQAILRLLESLGLGANMTLQLQVLEQMRDGLGLSDDAIGSVLAMLTEALGLADTPHGIAVIARDLVDALGLSGQWTATQEVLALVATVLALRDHGHQTETALMADTLELSDAVMASATQYMQLLEQLRLADVPRGTALLSALVSERLALGDELTTTAQLLKLLREAMALRVEVQDGDAPFVAWVLNAESRAAWTYDNWPFNSYAEIDGHHYAAGPTGIVELGGDDDDGEAIAARLRTGLSNLGTGRMKRVESAYLGYTTDGQIGLAVTITSPTGEKAEHRYLMRVQPAQAMREGRVKVGRGLKSVFWQLEVHNVDGADFELHDLQLLPMILDRSV